MAVSCLIFVLLFAYFPLLGWIIAFINYQPGLKLSQCDFVGLRYFILAVKQPDLLPVLWNTIVMSMLGLLCSPIPAFFAISLSEIRFNKFSRFVQTMTTFPNFISWVLVFSVFYAMFSPNDGVLNKVLLSLHLVDQPVNPIGNPDIVYFFQTGIGLWKSMGFSAIIYLASLAGIDPGLYDAASIDGAGRFRKILHVKIPGLYPTYFVLLLLAIGQLLNNGFEQYYFFYNGLVGDKIEVLDYYVYRLGVLGNGYSLATAIGITKTAISILLLVGANGLSKRVRGVSIL